MTNRATFRILAFNRAPVRIVTIDSDGLNRAAIEGYTDLHSDDDGIDPMDQHYVRCRVFENTDLEEMRGYDCCANYEWIVEFVGWEGL